MVNRKDTINRSILPPNILIENCIVDVYLLEFHSPGFQYFGEKNNETCHLMLPETKWKDSHAAPRQKA
jgi:hypothetical protein